MPAATIDRINHLVEERSRLYRQNRRGADDVRRQITEVNRELEGLWEARRRERAGQRDGVDLLVHRAYEELYGRAYEDTVQPATVDEAEDVQSAEAA